jgi:hypothetical protein
MVGVARGSLFCRAGAFLPCSALPWSVCHFVDVASSLTSYDLLVILSSSLIYKQVAAFWMIGTLYGAASALLLLRQVWAFAFSLLV